MRKGLSIVFLIILSFNYVIAKDFDLVTHTCNYYLLSEDERELVTHSTTDELGFNFTGSYVNSQIKYRKLITHYNQNAAKVVSFAKITSEEGSSICDLTLRMDFFRLTNPNSSFKSITKTKSYDCSSNEDGGVLLEINHRPKHNNSNVKCYVKRDFF